MRLPLFLAPADRERPTRKVHPVADDHEVQATYGESMSQKNIALSIARSPWSQAVAGGLLTLIPGRKYPAWLRQTITWGSTAATAALIAFPELGSKVLERASGQETPQITRISPTARAGFAAVVGASMYGMLRLGWWFDEAAEQALRKMRVPFPRVVLGIAVGALYYYTDDRKQKEVAAG